VRDHTTKHTHENVLEVPEVVIHIVSYAMVQQMSLSSTEYPKGVNEFVKAGFTQVPSLIVRPPRVKESPVAFECKVTRIIPTGDQGGSGILLMSEIQCVHVHDDLLDEKGKIDPVKLDVVGRLGGEGYCRVQGAAIFSVPKPAGIPGIGFDQIPDRIRYSSVLTGNDLGLLASVSVLPQGASLPAAPDPEWHAARMQGEEAVHRLAQAYLAKGDVHGAWRTLLA
jgi:flavin reductase (DIM6/NTAB) family NADH-FMN oxidoreductase RutF